MGGACGDEHLISMHPQESNKTSRLDPVVSHRGEMRTEWLTCLMK